LHFTTIMLFTEYPPMTAHDIRCGRRRGLFRLFAKLTPVPHSCPTFSSTITKPAQEPSSSLYVPSLVDVIRLYEEVFVDHHHILHSASIAHYEACFQSQSLTSGDDTEISVISEVEEVHDECEASQSNLEPTNDKLVQLEDELSKLRAMIAAVVVKQESSNSSVFFPPAPPLPGMSVMSSGGPPPPPPPPPPLPTGLPDAKKHTLSDIMKAHKKTGQGVPGGSSKPTMADVLAKIGSVKLKSVQHTEKKQAVEIESSDPATMIAMALKRKFANRVVQDSPGGEADAWKDKENAMLQRRKEYKKEEAAPAFGVHMLKKAKKKAPLSPRVTTA